MYADHSTLVKHSGTFAGTGAMTELFDTPTVSAMPHRTGSIRLSRSMRKLMWAVLARMTPICARDERLACSREDDLHPLMKQSVFRDMGIIMLTEQCNSDKCLISVEDIMRI